MNNLTQTAFVIDRKDNTATALSPLPPGNVRLIGDAAASFLSVAEEIPDGHKIALRNIKKGEKIIKYGVSIGEATRDIEKGSWVHLHCMRSLFDERSSRLDVRTGAPRDVNYE